MTELDYLERAGEVLHGRGVWKDPLADDLGVSDVTLRRWASGRRSIPDGVWADLRALLVAHSEQARELAATLPVPPHS